MKKKGERAEYRPYDVDINIRNCPKCGRQAGWSLTYNDPTDRLIVTCRCCGYRFDMEPMKRGD